MKTLYEFSKLNNTEFLSFLYEERDRQVSKSGAPGWSLWALVCSAFAIGFYVYNCLKEVELINYLLCYYIFSVFCPIVLYIVFIIEQNRKVGYGDSKHVERLKNIAPIPLFVCLLGVYSILIVMGYAIGASTESVIRCTCVVIPIIVSLITIVFERNKLVTTFLSFRVSANDWWNGVLMFLVTGSILTPLYGTYKHLTFGFSYEFEVTFAIVMLITVMYLFIQNKMNGSRVSDIDVLIEGFLYRDWTKESIIRKLELMKLGKTPFMELEKEYNKVVDASGIIENTKKRATEISSDIKQNGLTLEKYDGLHKEIKGMTSAITAVLNSQKQFNDKAKVLIDLKSTLDDPEFRAMLDTAYNLPFVNKLFDDCGDIMNIVDSEIFPAIDNLKDEIERLSCCRECPNRVCKEAER